MFCIVVLSAMMGNYWHFRKNTLHPSIMKMQADPTALEFDWFYFN